jgi:hypothetical protein
MNNLLYGNYRTRSFNDIYNNEEKFLEDFTIYSELGLNPNLINDSSIKTIFYLLCAKYGNSHISNSDENQFKLKLFSNIFQYAPYWEKKLDVQSRLRNLSEEELRDGAKQINNHSYNPSTAPSTDTLDELITTNEQTATKFKKSRLDAYGLLLELLERDVTEEFLNKFKKLFLVIVEPQLPLWYITDTNSVGGNEDDVQF